MKNQYKSSRITNHKIAKEIIFDGVPSILSQTSPGFYVSAVQVF